MHTLARGAALCLCSTFTVALAQDAGSSSAPDVVGIKVGASSLAEAKAALQKLSPAVSTWDVRVKLHGTSTARAIQGAVEVPNGEYVGQMIAHTTAYHPANSTSTNCNRGASNETPCEVIYVIVTPPPKAGTVVEVRRSMTYGTSNGPTVDTLISSLSTKYGKPALVDNYNNQGTSYTLAWAWGANGTPTAVPRRDHACARSMSYGQVTAMIQNAVGWVQSGCGVVIKVTITAQNSVVRSFELSALHNAVAAVAGIETDAWLKAAVAEIEGKERANA